MATKQITIALGVVRNQDGHFLVGKRHQPEQPEVHGKWNFLGGRIEYGESPEETLVREIKEESGLEVGEVKLLPRVFSRYRQHIDGTQLQIVVVPYECVVVGGELLEVSSDPRVSELKFISPAEIRNYELVQGEIEILELVGI